MSQIENWSSSETDKTSKAKFDSFFTRLAPDLQNNSFPFDRSSQSASEALVASNILPGLSLDGFNSSGSDFGSQMNAQAIPETAGAFSKPAEDRHDWQHQRGENGEAGNEAIGVGAGGDSNQASTPPSESNQISSELALIEQELGTLLSDFNLLQPGQQFGATSGNDSGADSATSPAPVTESTVGATTSPQPNPGSSEVSAGMPSTGASEVSAGMPSTGASEVSAGMPSTGASEVSAGTQTGSGDGASSNGSAGNAGFIGVFGGDTDAAEAQSLSAALGKTVVPSAGLDASQPAAQTTQYEVGQYASWVAANPGTGMILNVPLTFDGQTLASTASGANNSEFTQIAQQLVAAGQGNDTIRLGVEMNGPWATANYDGNPTDFKNAYNEAAEAMKAVPGANFSFDWNPGDGEYNNIPTEAYYPGGANVNTIGVDVYDQDYGNTNATSAQTWNVLTTEAGGLNELAAFAQQQGKPFAIPEYAVAAPYDQAGNANAGMYGIGDDPNFITNIANFLSTQAQNEGVAFQSYFDSPSGGVGTSLEDSPNSYQAYINAFSDGGIDGAEE